MLLKITLLTSVLNTSSASRTSLSCRHQSAPGATVVYKGGALAPNAEGVTTTPEELGATIV
ncbi:hypothetical protein OMAG_001448, partial [Candidatus Omnitrophus magneticus]